MRGVLDRMEDGLAVILVEEKGDEFTVSANDLPEGSEEGTWFQLSHNRSGYAIIKIDQTMTEKQTDKSLLLQKKLRQRKRPSKFKRT